MERDISKKEEKTTLTTADVLLLQKLFVTNEYFTIFENRFDEHMLAIGQTFVRHEERFDRIESSLGILVRQMDIIIDGNKEIRRNIERLVGGSSLHGRSIDSLSERVEVLEKARM